MDDSYDDLMHSQAWCDALADLNARPVQRSDRQLRRIRVTEALDPGVAGLNDTRWHMVRRLI